MTRARVPALMPPRDCPQSLAKEATGPGSRNKVSLRVPEARHAPESRAQPGMGDLLPLDRASVTPLSPRIHPRPGKGGLGWIGFPPLQPSRVTGSGAPSSLNPSVRSRGSQPSAAPPCPCPVAEGLPLGGEQTELQPAWQHLRLSWQLLSEEHSFTQSVLLWSWGHTPGFSAPAPGDGGSRELSGRIEASPTGIPTPCSKSFTF